MLVPFNPLPADPIGRDTLAEMYSMWNERMVLVWPALAGFTIGLVISLVCRTVQNVDRDKVPIEAPYSMRN
jgi:hypothetical protein